MNQYGNLESSLAGHLMKTYVKSARSLSISTAPRGVSETRCAP